MSDETKPTAADLRAYADAWQRGSAVEPAICRYLRAGADAMDERDEYESLYRNLQQEMAAAQKIIVSQGAELAQLAERDAVAWYIAELNAALAQDRAELARLRAEKMPESLYRPDDAERQAHRVWSRGKDIIRMFLSEVAPLWTPEQNEHNAAAILARLAEARLVLEEV